MVRYLGEREPSFIDLSIVNASTDGPDPFRSAHNLIVDGPPRILLDRIATHVKHGCYNIVSLNIGGPIDHTATCVAVISTRLSRKELRQRGFEWHGLEEASASVEPVQPEPFDENQIVLGTSDFIRMDFVNGHWNSSYQFIRGAIHHGSIEGAIITIDSHVKAGCYRLEALSAVKDWCTVTIDTGLTQEELRKSGFVWHGLEPREDEDENIQPIVLPGHSLADDYWVDEDGVRHNEPTKWRAL